MIKIFSFDKTIYLINSASLFKPEEGSILLDIHSAGEIQTKYNKLMNKKKLNEIYFFNENPKQLFSYFSAMFRIIEAAGGLVKNKKNETLFIFRNGKWDLPKGKIEKGEGVKIAAVREVQEECGISGLTIIKELPSTYHTYFMEEKAILKRTHWFEMRCDEASALVPQTEEGITQVKWIASNDLKQVIDNTYESIKDVIGKYG
jgi:8-oxo-dGTP pyrophosphatase MutT (NUDIX family)